jgi:hypothetical protein
MTIMILRKLVLVSVVWFWVSLAYGMMPQQRISCEPEMSLLLPDEAFLPNEPLVPMGWRMFGYTQKLTDTESIRVRLNLVRAIQGGSSLESDVSEQNSTLVRALEISGANGVVLTDPVVRQGCYRVKATYMLANYK